MTWKSHLIAVDRAQFVGVVCVVRLFFLPPSPPPRSFSPFISLFSLFYSILQENFHVWGRDRNFRNRFPLCPFPRLSLISPTSLHPGPRLPSFFDYCARFYYFRHGNNGIGPGNLPPVHGNRRRDHDHRRVPSLPPPLPEPRPQFRRRRSRQFIQFEFGFHLFFRFQ